jgi:ABC-type xylose transport system permease subunit
LPWSIFAACAAAGVVAYAASRARGSHGEAAASPWRRALSPEVVLLAVVGLGGTLLFAFDRGLPVPLTILVAVTLAGVFLSRATVFGRSLYAIGGNEQAAVLSGVRVPRVKLYVYTIMGLLAGVCGIILAGRLNSATPTEGQLLELDAIASVVIGGASLSGGVGGIVGSIIGAFIIGTLNNGMDMLEISSNWQMITKGIIIIFAVYSDARLRLGVRRRALA